MGKSESKLACSDYWLVGCLINKAGYRDIDELIAANDESAFRLLLDSQTKSLTTELNNNIFYLLMDGLLAEKPSVDLFAIFIKYPLSVRQVLFGLSCLVSEIDGDTDEEKERQRDLCLMFNMLFHSNRERLPIAEASRFFSEIFLRGPEYTELKQMRLLDKQLVTEMVAHRHMFFVLGTYHENTIFHVLNLPLSLDVLIETVEYNLDNCKQESWPFIIKELECLYIKKNLRWLMHLHRYVLQVLNNDVKSLIYRCFIQLDITAKLSL